MSEGAAWLAGVLGLMVVLVHIGICVLALGVLPGNRKPSSGMAWLILILVLPYFGFVVFLLFGSTSVGRKRRAWQSEVNARVLAAVREEPVVVHPPEGPRRSVDDLTKLNQALGAFPMSTGNTVELLADYDRSIDAMRAEVGGARRCVHVEFYISAWDSTTSEFFDALVAAADRGVDVRFLF